MKLDITFDMISLLLANFACFIFAETFSDVNLLNS